MKPILVYGGIRVGLFAVALAVLLVIEINPFLAAVLAATIALCIAYLAFSRQRVAAAQALAGRHRRGEGLGSPAGADEEAEDALEGDRRRES